MADGNETPLESWKEIAAYLSRDVRTAIRWEKREGLPVHRHHHKSRSSVYAYACELDAWRGSRKPEVAAGPMWRRLPWRPIPAFASAIALALVLLTAGSGPRSATASAQAAESTGIVVRQVWAGPGAAGESISPDSRYLVFADYSKTGRGNIAVRDLETETTHYLTTEADGDRILAGNAVFSTDGSQIVYGWYDYNVLRELRIVARDGSTGRVLRRGDRQHAIAALDWSPDGREILGLRRLAHSGSLEACELVSISIEDGSIRLLRSLDESPVSTTYSPDGHYIAFGRPTRDTSQHDIFLLSSDGARESALVEHPAFDYAVGWAPDGRHLYFESDRTGDWSLWRVPVADGKADGPEELVKRNTGRLAPIGITTDGSLYYSLSDRGSDVYSADLGPAAKVSSTPRPMIERFTGKNANPAWSPDGRRLAYYSMRGQAPTMGILSIRDEETGAEGDLTVKLSWFRGLKWFPEGRSLMAYGVSLDGTTACFRIDAETGDASRLFDIDHGYTPWPVLSPDGKRVYHLESSRIVEHDLVSGAERTVQSVPEGAQFVELAISPDGELLATKLYWENKKPYSLVVLPVDTGEMRELTSIPPPHWFMNIAWMPDGEHLLFTKQYEDDEQRVELWRVAVATGQEQNLGLSFQGIHNLSIHPDGRRIAFTYTHATNEVWVMERILEQPRTQP